MVILLKTGIDYSLLADTGPFCTTRPLLPPDGRTKLLAGLGVPSQEK